MRKPIILFLVLTAMAWGFSAPMAQADLINGTIFYTTFGSGQNVWKVDYNFNGAAFTLGPSTNIASTPLADGILFAPDGNLIVSGQNLPTLSPQLHEITAASPAVSVKDVSAGTPGTSMGAYHMALSSNASNATLYNMWNGGVSGPTAISATVLSGGGLSADGINYTVTATAGASTDVRGVIFNPINGKWYYGTAPDGGSGEFGTVVFNDVTHTATLTRLKTGLFAHGLSFDPFTGNVIVNSQNTIQQLDADGNVLSTVTGPGNFDQAAEDGKGHLFVASNSGFLQFVDYHATGLIGAAGNFSAAPFLAETLDDIAPLSGPGAPVPVPPTVLLLGSGLLGLVGFRKFKK